VITIYLVEDDPLVARHALDALAAEPQIRCVGHAPDIGRARTELPHLRPHVLLTDMGLPDGDGSALVRAVRSGELGAASDWAPHILVFSVFGDESRVVRAIEAGADGYFLKGCSADELVRHVTHAAQGGSPISPAIARHVLKRLHSGLPTQEAEVLRLVAQGYVSEEISQRLHLSAAALAQLVRGIYRRLHDGLMRTVTPALPVHGGAA
jgi:DNA-binding NarL/FixJ family response regulator